MYEYKCKLVKVVDGDTIDVDIDLGFGVWMRKQRIRLYGIDTPESRTSDKVEKVYGNAAKDFLVKWTNAGDLYLKTFKDGKGKFGRILGEFRIYDGEQDIGNILNPLLFAGLIIEGGIVGYDSNTQSGGQGARYFGIGLSEQYRVAQVTVAMRIVSVQTGEILLTTNVTKTIASHSSGGDVFRFLDMGTKALELETGVAVNEPVNYAIRTAIEFAVLELIKSGEKR